MMTKLGASPVNIFLDFTRKFEPVIIVVNQLKLTRPAIGTLVIPRPLTVQVKIKEPLNGEAILQHGGVFRRFDLTHNLKRKTKQKSTMAERSSFSGLISSIKYRKYQPTTILLYAEIKITC